MCRCSLKKPSIVISAETGSRELKEMGSTESFTRRSAIVRRPLSNRRRREVAGRTVIASMSTSMSWRWKSMPDSSQVATSSSKVDGIDGIAAGRWPIGLRCSDLIVELGLAGSERRSVDVALGVEVDQALPAQVEVGERVGRRPRRGRRRQLGHRRSRHRVGEHAADQVPHVRPRARWPGCGCRRSRPCPGPCGRRTTGRRSPGVSERSGPPHLPQTRNPTSGYVRPLRGFDLRGASAATRASWRSSSTIRFHWPTPTTVPSMRRGSRRCAAT